jgi:hypothetical protein
LREDYDWTDPEQTERLLRPVRAVDDAYRADRVREGIALQKLPAADTPLDQIYGFRIEETLAVFGGEAAVQRSCPTCPANALAIGAQPVLAGCYGVVYLDDPATFHAAIDEIAQRARLSEASESCFGAIRPRWYGLWLRERIDPATCELLLAIFEDAGEAASEAAPGLVELIAAVRVSLDTGLPLYTRLIPRGRRLQYGWKLDSHCKRCKAPRPISDPVCQVCGLRGDVCAGRTRKVRGSRPYYPLLRQIAPERVRALAECCVTAPVHANLAMNR